MSTPSTKEVIFLRTFAIASSLIIFYLSQNLNKSDSFKTINVERVNIVEPDGTVKMIISNKDKFPSGDDIINKRPTNPNRTEFAGILFFNEEGIENGGLIYNGKKNEKGHSAGMSLTFDQYDGDQVFQILKLDNKKEGKRKVSSSIVFNDRVETESQLQAIKLVKQLNITKDEEKKKELLDQAYKDGVIGGGPRLQIGKLGNSTSGMFIFDKDFKQRIKLIVDKNNDPKLQFLDKDGKVIYSIPPNK